MVVSNFEDISNIPIDISRIRPMKQLVQSILTSFIFICPLEAVWFKYSKET